MTMRSLLLIIITLFITACGTNMQASNPIATTSLEESSIVSSLNTAEKDELEQPSIIFFHAAWCQICTNAKPPMKELADTYKNEIDIIEMDIDQASSRSALLQYQISATPTFILLSAEGNVLASIPGWPGKAAMENTISQLILYK